MNTTDPLAFILAIAFLAVGGACTAMVWANLGFGNRWTAVAAGIAATVNAGGFFFELARILGWIPMWA